MYYGKSGGSGDTLSPEIKHKQCVLFQRELLSEIHPKYTRPVNYIGAVIICARQCQCGHCTNMITSLQVVSTVLSELAKTDALSPPNDMY